MALTVLPPPAPSPLVGCRIELDPGTTLLDDDVLVGGSPLRVLRLSSRGADALAELKDGRATDGGDSGALARRLVDAGLAHPHWERSPYGLDDLTVVIPVRERAQELDALLRSLEGLACLVVDDASMAGDQLREIAGRYGAQLVRAEHQLGPGGARNLGARRVATPIVCFVDSDVSVEQVSLERLLQPFSDPLVAAVAPRIRGPLGTGLRARFEHDASPLDMGPSPSPVRPGSQVSYVPAALLLVRQELAVELFDERLQVGEDVDAVWRLAEAGWGMRYEPSVEASHPSRASWSAWLRQRHRYGRSASLLEERHGELAAPLRGSGWALAAWALCVAGRPLAAGALLFGGVPELRDQLDGVVAKPGEEALMLTAERVASSAPLVARQLLRSYGPLLLVAGLSSRRARRSALAIALLSGLGRWRRAGAGLDPLRFVALSTLDDLAYASGLWRGALESRRSGALRPRLVRGRQRRARG